ncbi:MAG: hypothetical protein IPP31_06250 [Chitinophagaceae bacterium]|nr:hypothetical protein [Chitinophagaceae bacterium]
MSELNDQIKRVNDKLQQLLKNHQLLQKDHERQSKLIQQLQESKKNDALQIAAMKEQLSIARSAAGQMNEADKKEFERTINRYIREIDKCIGLLSE